MRNGRSTMGPGHKRQPRPLADDHFAVILAKTRFLKSVRNPGGDAPVLKSGEHSGKLGGRIMKGMWRGFPVYTLKLEERATCPSTCLHWRSCYGNNMPFAHRFKHGPALEERLLREVGGMCLTHPRGFAVRLHDLGDFYSVRYVKLWGAMLHAFPQLHCFGYTARIDPADPISAEIAALVKHWWPRFAIRQSNGRGVHRTTVSILHPDHCPPDAIVCPAQTGKTDTCSTCALCWSTDRRIAFVQH
jgi:hypothetical protein